LGRYFPISDDMGAVTDKYEPARVIARAKYLGSFTTPSTSLVPSGPSSVIFAYRWNSPVTNVVISLAVELRDVTITCNLGASGMKYARSI
jgi:hypothetical protein